MENTIISMNFAKVKINYLIYFLILISFYIGMFEHYVKILMIVLFHEACHILIMKIFNCKINTIYITPIGCLIDFDDYGLSKINRILIYSMGIIGNITLLLFLKSDYLIKFNKFMIIFNLMIIFPLDGFRILNEILDIFYEKEYLNYLMFLIAMCFIILFTFLIIVSKYYGYFLLVFFLLIKNIKYYIDNKRKYKISYYQFLNPSVRR